VPAALPPQAWSEWQAVWQRGGRGMSRFVAGVAVGLALGAIGSAWAVPVIIGNGVLLGWKVSGVRRPGDPKMIICSDPTIQPFEKLIECHKYSGDPADGIGPLPY
jgi:hypothetical protein